MPRNPFSFSILILIGLCFINPSLSLKVKVSNYTKPIIPYTSTSNSTSFYYDSYIILLCNDQNSANNPCYQMLITDEDPSFTPNNCTAQASEYQNGYINLEGDFYIPGCTNNLTYILHMNPITCIISNTSNFTSASDNDPEIYYSGNYVIFYDGTLSTVVDTRSNQIVFTHSYIIPGYSNNVAILNIGELNYCTYNSSSLKLGPTVDAIFAIMEIKLNNEQVLGTIVVWQENSMFKISVMENDQFIQNYTIEEDFDTTLQVSYNQLSISFSTNICLYTIQSLNPLNLTSSCAARFLNENPFIVGSDLYFDIITFHGSNTPGFAFVQNLTDLSVQSVFSGIPNIDMGNGLTYNAYMYKNNWSSQKWILFPYPNRDFESSVSGDYVFFTDFESIAFILSPNSPLTNVSISNLFDQSISFYSFAYDSSFDGGFYFVILNEGENTTVYNIAGDAIVSIQVSDYMYFAMVNSNGLYLYNSSSNYIAYNFQSEIMESGTLDCKIYSLAIIYQNYVGCLNIKESTLILYYGSELFLSYELSIYSSIFFNTFQNLYLGQINLNTKQIEYYYIKVENEILLFGLEGQNYSIPPSSLYYPNGVFYSYPEYYNWSAFGQIYEVSSLAPYDPSETPSGIEVLIITGILTIGIYLQDFIAKWRRNKKLRIFPSVESREKLVQEHVWIPWLSEKNWVRFRMAFVAGTGFFISSCVFANKMILFLNFYDSEITNVYEILEIQDLTTFLYVFYPITFILGFLSLTIQSRDWREKLPFNLCIHMIITTRIAVSVGSTLFSNPYENLGFLAYYILPYYNYLVPIITIYILGLTILALITLASPFLSFSKLQKQEIILHEMRDRIEKVNSGDIPPLDVDDKIIEYCEFVGRSSFFSFRNLTILTSIIPGIVNLFLSKGTLEINDCFDPGYELLPEDYCSLTLFDLNISYSVSIWNNSWVSFATLVIISLFLFTMIRAIIILHKYRAKFFAARVKFSDQMTLPDILMDIIWNAIITYMLIYLILDQVNEAIPSGLTPIEINEYDFQFKGAVFSNTLKYTSPDGFQYENLYASFQSEISVFGPISFVALLGSLYGLMFHSKSSALLSFFRERDLLILATVSDLKIRYEISNEGNQALEFIRKVYLWFPKESPRTKITALMSYFEAIGMMKQTQMTLDSWNPKEYFGFKQK